MALNDTQTKVHLDAASNDPKQARGELKINVGIYNAMVALLKTIATLNIGDGVKDDGSGNLDLDLGTNPGLRILAGQLLAKVGAGNKLTASGIELAINELTADASPDIATDWVATYDDSAGVLKKVQLDDLGGTPAPDSITQTEIANAAVGQGELKTAIGEVSVTNTSFINRTLPGGQYGHYPQIKESGGSSSGARIADSFNNGSYVTNIALQGNGGDTAFAQQRYIQASPPYELGGIIIPTFIFAMIENGTGKILGMYQAADPPWANNGPTVISPQRIDRQTGKAFRTVRTRKPLTNVNDADFWTDTEVEVTPEFKNSDMGLIPHPFIGNDLTGKTIVMIDPRMKLVERLHEMIEVGESPLELFHNDNIRVGNTDIPAVTRPSGVMVVNATLQ